MGSFTFSNAPTAIAANRNAVVSMAYDPTEAGNRAVHAIAYSDGSNKILDIFGTAGSQPKVLVEFQSIDGQSWIPFTPGKNFIFGDGMQGNT